MNKKAKFIHSPRFYFVVKMCVEESDEELMFKLGMNKMFYTFLCISECSKSPYACKTLLFTNARKSSCTKCVIMLMKVTERERERCNMNSDSEG